MDKAPYKQPSRAKLRTKARRIAQDFMADPQFQAALQEIREQFNIPVQATPKAMEAWYDTQFGGPARDSLSTAIDDWEDPAARHFVQEVGRYVDAMSKKHGISLTLEWSLQHPFDRAVDDTLRRLGLPEKYREFFVGCLWGQVDRFVPISPSYGVGRSRVSNFCMITLTITPYDSRKDVLTSLQSIERWWRRTSQTLKARPTKIWDHRRLQQSIIEAVQANNNRPKAQQQTRTELMQALWQDTRAQGWHDLNLAGFKALFFNTLRVQGLTRKYMC